MTTNPTTQLDRMIRAQYPVIAISSYEEERVERAVKELADSPKHRKVLMSWTVSQGLQQIGGRELPKRPEADETKDPVACLSTIYGWANDCGKDTPTLFLVKDLHGFATDPVVLRWIRDIALLFQLQPNTLILVSPGFNVPADLEKDIAVLDWPLPDEQELADIVDTSINSLPKTVKCDLQNGSREKVIRALAGLTASEAASVLSMAVISNGALDERAISFIIAEKKQIVKKSGVLEFFDTDTNANDIGGLDALKDYTRRTRAAFSKEARAYGLDVPRGFLMVGVPGAGKSLTAKASTGGQMPLLRLDVGALMGSLVGQSESNARSALKVAEASAPCVLWIDEVEKGFAGMGGSGENDGGTSRRMLGTILTWMQEHTAPVYVVATANDVSSLPPELLRRFDTLWFVDLPSVTERETILGIHLRKRARKPEEFDLAELAASTDGFTGAEIEKVVQSAMVAGFDDGARPITTDDLLQACREVVPVSRTMGEKINALRDWAKTRARLANSPDPNNQTSPTRRQLEI